MYDERGEDVVVVVKRGSSVRAQRIGEEMPRDDRLKRSSTCPATYVTHHKIRHQVGPGAPALLPFHETKI